MKRYISLIALLLVMTSAVAQNKEKLNAPNGTFNHLSVGPVFGTLGIGADAVMPVSKIIDVRAGFSSWLAGQFNFKAINTATEINQIELVEEDAVRYAGMVDKVELALKPRCWNAYVLAQIHPIPGQMFYIAGGFFFGSKTVLNFCNTNDGALEFLYDANQKVQDYNDIFHTNYQPIGLKFGDYIFTADDHGNIDVKMRTNPVKPYFGIGFGNPIAEKGRFFFNLDTGLMFWGAPKFVLNDGTEVKSTGKDAGVTSVLSWLRVFPVLQLRLSWKIF